MITNEIARDKRINDLSDDTSRLAFTWLITFADSEGRTYGDPALVRSMLFPRRTDITFERMAGIIQEWHRLGLVVWYEAQGDRFIYFPSFEKHQVGLRKDREAPSTIPAPPAVTQEEIPQSSAPVVVSAPEPVRSNDGVEPEKIGLIKEKLIKEKGAKSAPPDGEARPNGRSFWMPDILGLANSFAHSRGCSLPALSGPRDFREVNKRWKEPLATILHKCEGNAVRAARLIELSCEHMARDNLTFDAPDQILKVAGSLLADLSTGKLADPSFPVSPEQFAANALAGMNFEIYEDPI
jgi:hypothetical protein